MWVVSGYIYSTEQASMDMYIPITQKHPRKSCGYGHEWEIFISTATL